MSSDSDSNGVMMCRLPDAREKFHEFTFVNQDPVNPTLTCALVRCRSVFLGNQMTTNLIFLTVETLEVIRQR